MGFTIKLGINNQNLQTLLKNFCQKESNNLVQEFWGKLEYAIDPSMEASATETPDNSNTGSDVKPQIIYRFKKCRRVVASQDLVVSHEPGDGQTSFKWKKRSKNPGDQELPECLSIFVVPMRWMETVQDGCVGDKIQYMGCKTRLGSFNWAGMQCNCGRWINPAFQLHKSRIDECQL